MTDSLLSRNTLKSLYQTGDTPVGSDYNDWITTMATQSGENTFTADAQTFLGNLSACGDIHATAFYGDGSNLTGVGGSLASYDENGLFGGTIADGYNSIVQGCNTCTTTGGCYSIVGGGQINCIHGCNSTIGGGINNTINGNSTTIGGGHGNNIQNCCSTIGGGTTNYIGSEQSTIAGGSNNKICVGACGSSIVGKDNTVSASSEHTHVIGCNITSWCSNFTHVNNLIACCNIHGQNVCAGNFYGDGSNLTGVVATLGSYTESGTFGNNGIASSLDNIAQGTGNCIFTGVSNSVVGGGCCNCMCGNSSVGTIAGGGCNVIEANAHGNNSSVVGGGLANCINNSCIAATIAGGQFNYICSNGSVIGGGLNNSIKANWSTIAGGCGNTIDSNLMAPDGCNNNILGSNNFICVNVQNAHIVGCNIVASTNDHTYVNNLCSQNNVCANYFYGDGSGLTNVGGGPASPSLSSYKESTLGGFGNSLVHGSNAVAIGTNNIVCGSYSIVAGGNDNVIDSNTYNSSIIGSVSGNYIGQLAESNTIISSISSSIANQGCGNFIVGGACNNIGTLVADSFIIGNSASNILGHGVNFNTGRSGIIGGANNIICNDVVGCYNTIINGFNNCIDCNAKSITIIGTCNSTPQNTCHVVVIGDNIDSNFVNQSCYVYVNNLHACCNVCAGYLYGDGANITNLPPATLASYCEVGAFGGNSVGGTNSISQGTNNCICHGASCSIIGGGVDNAIGCDSSTAIIAGGDKNLIGNPSTSSQTVHNSIVGGYGNIITGQYATANIIGGGCTNTLCNAPLFSVIGGGRDNRINDNQTLGLGYTTIAGGSGNLICGYGTHSAIGGGYGNIIDYAIGTIGGGCNNYIHGDNGTIAGGGNNTIGGSASIIGGGFTNTIVGGGYGIIGGGRYNTIHGTNNGSVIVGGGCNCITNNYSHCSFIGGGETNLVGAKFSVVVGGSGNIVNGESSFIGGGTQNTISASNTGSSITAGVSNWIDANITYGNILGGTLNTVSHNHTFIAGSYITTSVPCALHANCLILTNLPTCSAGLPTGAVWNDNGVLCIA